MNTLFHFVKLELYYQYKSKLILLLSIALFLLVSFSAWSQGSLVEITENKYLDLESYYKQENLDIEEALSSDFKVETSGNVETVYNEIKLAHLTYQASLVGMQPRNAVNQLLSSAMFFLFPFVISLYTILIASYDFKYNTLKARLSHISYHRLNAIKILTTLLVSIIALFISITVFTLFQIIGRILFVKESTIAVNMNAINGASFLNRAPLQIMFFIILILINILIFYFITVIFRSNVIPIIILFTYNLLIPTLGKYDFKAILLTIFPKLFNTNASTFENATITPVALDLSTFIVWSIGLSLFIYFASKYSQMKAV